MQVWNVLHAARWKYRTQKSRQKSPYGHYCTTLSGYIFATRARIDNQKKNLLSSNMSSTCSHNMVNLRPSNGWDRFGSLGHPCKFQLLSRLGSFTARHSGSGRQPNFAALSRMWHLCSTGRPSRCALAHILVISVAGWTEYMVWHWCVCSLSRTVLQRFISTFVRRFWRDSPPICSWNVTFKWVALIQTSP